MSSRRSAAGRGGGGGGGGEPCGEAPAGTPDLRAADGNIINPIPGATVQFNWNTLMRLSPHNPSTLHGRRSLAVHFTRPRQQLDDDQGARQGHRSQCATTDGRSYSQPELQPDAEAVRGLASRASLSKNDGYVANEFGTMTELAESPIIPGILWAGTDDGNIQLSRDGGTNWEEVGKNIPGVNHEYYVSGIEASWYDAGDGVHRARRPSPQRSQAVRLQDHRLRQDVDVGLRQSAGIRKREFDSPGPGQSQSLVRADGAWLLRVAGRWKAWNRFMPNLPIGPHGRSARASA